MRTLRHLLILAAFVAGGLHLCGTASFAAPSLYPVTITLPGQALDLSDLDLRDANNKPIRSLAARRKMESLFVSGLNRLLVQNLTPQKRLLLGMLASTWDITSGWIRKGIRTTVFLLEGWFKESKIKKGIDNQFAGNLTGHGGDEARLHARRTGTRFLFLLDALLSSTHILR